MKSYSIIYFEHRNDVTSIIKLCLENTSRRRVFSVKLDYACDVISMFKITVYNSLNWVESNTSWTVKIKVYTLMCVSEEPLQYVANQNIHVARHLYILSRDKTTDLPYDLICRTTSL